MSVKIIVNGSHCKLVGILTKEVMIDLDKMCSFKPEGIEYSEKVKNDDWDGVIHLFQSRHFPIGLLHRVQMYLRISGVDFDVIDNRQFHSARITLKSTFKMRDYQEQVVQDAIKAERALIPVSVGGGKSIISVEIIARLGLKTLFICPTIEILEQIKGVLETGLGVKIGLIHEKTFDPQHVTVTTWQTINAKIKVREKVPNFMAYLSGVDNVIFDECLHKDTLIALPDNKTVPIKEIYDNPHITHVMSYNEVTNIIEPKRILRRFKNPMPTQDRWQELQIGGNNKRLLLTKNHKVWTTLGWKQSCDIQLGDIVKSYVKDQRRVFPCKDCGRYFDTTGSLGGHVSGMHTVGGVERNKRLIETVHERCRGKFKEIHRKAMKTRSNNIKYREYLSERMKGSKNPSKRPEVVAKVKPSMKEYYTKYPEKLEKRKKNFMNAPYRGRGYSGRQPTLLERKIMNMHIPGLRYTGNGSFWLKINGRHKNPDFVFMKKEKKVIEVGDIEYWHTTTEIDTVIKDYASVGWMCLYLTNKDMENMEESEGKILKFLFNHDVPVVKARTARGCPRYKTWRYNLEIEDNHNFFANGLLVSNCHHTASDKIFNVAMHINAFYRFGLSGSLFRSQGDEIKYYGAIGETVKGITASELIEMGYLVPPVITFRPVDSIPFGWNDKWRDVYEEAIINNIARNELIVDEARRLVKAGRTVLILVSEVAHGDNIKALMDEAVFLHASTKGRRGIVDSFRNGEIPCFLSTLMDEGVDFPEVTAIILAGAGKSMVKCTQRVGRGLRICPAIGKKDVIIIDFSDCSKYVYDHAMERYQIYKREPKFKINGDIPGGI